MGALDALLRGPRVARISKFGVRSDFVYPFAEKAAYFRGVFENPKLVRPWRDIAVIANALSTSGYRKHARALPMVLPAEPGGIADRRTWGPLPRAVSTSGVQVVPTDVSRPRIKSWSIPPGDPDYRPFVFPRNPQPYRMSPRYMTQLEYGPWWYGFKDPERTVICVKRKMRREVLHALGIAGHVGFRRAVFNWWSKVRC